MQLSYWEQNTFLNKIDVAIIGSGIVGLSAALYLKKQNPKLSVAVFERGFLPSGASTKNAGFCCFGSISELVNDLNKHTENEVMQLVEKRWKGLLRLRKNLGDSAIDYKPYSGYEVFDDSAKFNNYASQIDFFNSRVSKITKVKNPYSIADKKIKQFGLNGFKHIIENRAEGQIDTGKMMARLIDIVQKLGVKIFNGIDILSLDAAQKNVRINCQKNVQINAGRVLICTNGFAKQLLPDYPVNAARAQVMVTGPIAGLKLKGSFHYDEGYYFFRNIGNRVLLGGGRNLDFKTEATHKFGLTDKVQNKLEQLLWNNILNRRKHIVEYRWSGIMGIGPQKSTIIKKVDKNIFCAVRMGGMGVAIGSLVGEDAARMVAKSF
jgi:glycine/D-amino acid oxidase-like deaminating enzyme